jgi:hypothetical protein
MASRICPGFKLVKHTEWELECSNRQFHTSIDYDRDSGYPFTEICIHDKCQYDAEYWYALIMAIADKNISNSDIIRAAPQKPHTGYSDPFSLGVPKYCKNPKVGCDGYVIYKNDALQSETSNDLSNKKYVIAGIDYNPSTGDPYTRPCTHAEGECDPSVYLRWIFIRLIAKGLLNEDALQQIKEDGWAKRLKDAHVRGRIIMQLFCETIQDRIIYGTPPKLIIGQDSLKVLHLSNR